MSKNLKQYATLAGMLLCAAGMANAQTSNSIVVFSVDMSVQVNDSTFVPGTDSVEAHGTFNGWGALTLTNDPAAPNTNIYSGTTVDTTDPNGGTLQYKFVINGSNWETPATSQNRAARLPANSGDTLVLPTAFFNDAGPAETNAVTFQVDMAQQVNIGLFHPGVDEVDVRGNLNGWGTSVLTNDPSILVTNEYGLVTSNVYVGTYDVVASPGAAQAYKFYFNNGSDHWESPAAINQDGGQNRFFANVPQTLPVVYFSDAPYAPVATNEVTFQVDMSAQLLSGAFDPSLDTVDVRGSFNGWSGNVNICTNDPYAANTNIYSTVIQIVDGVGVNEQYKFTYSGPNVPGNNAINTAWEQPGPNTPQIGGNRFFAQPDVSSMVLPVVFFSDQPLNDLLGKEVSVTFSVDMNGAMGNDGYTFDPAYDTVFINGQFANWYGWWGGANPVAVPQYQLAETPLGSGIFSITLQLPAGTPVSFEYKYGIGEGGTPGPFDDEAGFGENHYRVVRTTGSGSYSMPQDTFGNMYREPLFGQLQIGNPNGGLVPVSWLGRPGLRLQAASDLSGSAWQDLFETDGTNWMTGYSSTNGFVSQTNWPATSTEFFRLIKPN